MTYYQQNLDFDPFDFNTKSQIIDQIYFEVESKYDFDFERFLIIYPVICKSLNRLYQSHNDI